MSGLDTLARLMNGQMFSASQWPTFGQQVVQSSVLKVAEAEVEVEKVESFLEAAIRMRALILRG